MSPLDGVRVLDLSRLLPGPACTWYLSGLGAAVDRVEPPTGGDPARAVPPLIQGEGAFFASMNAGDRSLALDLRHREGPAVLQRLLPQYDVLVEGFRPGVLEAVGLDPATLRARFPTLIVARLSGYGQTGPWSQRPGHDLNYQGLAGAVIQGGLTDRRPHVPGVQAADLGGAMSAALGIAAALYERGRTGLGQILDVSLTEAALSMVAPHVAIATAGGEPTAPGGGMLAGALPVYDTYRCSDGRWITVGALEPRFQRALLREVGSLDRDALRAAFAARPRDEWVERLADGCVGPVLDPMEIGEHPHLSAREAVEEVGGVHFVRPPFAPRDRARGPVPRLGEHTEAILTEAGLDRAEIAALRAAEAIR